jgi:DNA-binding beta-propeller fold protein YncE
MGKIESQKIRRKISYYLFSAFLLLFVGARTVYSESYLEFSKGRLTVEVKTPSLLSAYLSENGQAEELIFKDKYIPPGKHVYKLKGKFLSDSKFIFYLKSFAYKYLKTFGSFGNGPGNFFQPCALAVDKLNRLYVVDSNNDRVEVFNLNGGYVTEFGIFKWAEGDIFDNQDGDNFSSDSLFEEQGNNLNDPEDIAIGQFIYVLDKGNNRIVKFNDDYAFQKSIGKYGHGEMEFLDLRSIALSEIENLYCVDYERDRVIKCDSDGNYLFEVGAFGKGKDNLNRPVAVAVDSKRNFYVAEEGNKRIVVFDENGIYQYDFPCHFLKELTNVQVWKDYLYLIDAEAKKVYLYTKHGRKLLSIKFKDFEKPVDSVMINDKFLYVVDREANNVKIFEIKVEKEKFTRIP